MNKTEASEIICTHIPRRCRACRACDAYNWPCALYTEALAVFGFTRQP